MVALRSVLVGEGASRRFGTRRRVPRVRRVEAKLWRWSKGVGKPWLGRNSSPELLSAAARFRRSRAAVCGQRKEQRGSQEDAQEVGEAAGMGVACRKGLTSPESKNFGGGVVGLRRTILQPGGVERRGGRGKWRRGTWALCRRHESGVSTP